MKNCNDDNWADFRAELLRSLAILTALGLFLTLAASSKTGNNGESNRILVGWDAMSECN